jgi:nucleoid-associated protein YgaU
MGRETKILLGFLATLAGVFLGALSVKLLVPRPPAGAGPDIRTEVAVARPIELVEPPALDPPSAPRRRFAAAAADPMSAAPGADDFPLAEQSPPPAAAPSAAAGAAVIPAAVPAAVHRDPFVARTSFDAAASAVASEAAPPSAAPRRSDASPVAAAAVPGRVPVESTASPRAPRSTAAAAEIGDAAGYHCRPGDSWWNLAARAYGDGRLYRALFAWNRTIDPRVSLAPGTRLELPPRERLEAAWPRLLPEQAPR